MTNEKASDNSNEGASTHLVDLLIVANLIFGAAIWVVSSATMAAGRAALTSAYLEILTEKAEDGNKLAAEQLGEDDWFDEADKLSDVAFRSAHASLWLMLTFFAINVVALCIVRAQTQRGAAGDCDTL